MPFRTAFQYGRCALFAFLVMGALGCSRPVYTTYHRITPQVDPWFAYKDLATVCILRAEQNPSSPTVAYFDNRRFVGLTEHNGIYFCYLVRPGQHQLMARSTRAYPVKISFHAQPGQCYYFRQIHFPGGFNLNDTSTTTARKLMVHLLYAYVRSDPDAPPLYRMPVPARYAPSSW
ncbi:MAG: hypothetical protein H6728_15395 [Myxococcales bacterium]|nr:hypothetical protein [Myxococcales bacterium]MCB9644456.1 hypothetical protein [Myxococcales bacterium]